MCVGHYFGGSGKGEVEVAEDSFGKMLHKIKNPALCPLVLSKSLIIHKEVENYIHLLDLLDPIYKFAHRKRIICPGFFGKSKSNIITQTEVFQQYLELRFDGIDIHIIGTLPAQHVLGSLCQHRIIAEIGH